MYGEVIKSDEYKKVDDDFKKESLKQFKTLDSAVSVYTDYGWRYFYNNDLNTAMKRFNQAWLLDPEFPDPYFGFASLLEMQKKQTEAKRFYAIALEKDKTKERAETCYERIAHCKEQLGDQLGTLEAYKKIAIINNNNVVAFTKIGYFEKDNNEAMKAFARAIELDPKDPVTYNNRGWRMQLNRDFVKAIADYTKAIELDDKYIGAYVNRGISKMNLGDFKGAKEDFELSAKLDPKAGELRRFVGLAKLNLNDKTGACKDFEAAKKLGDPQIEEIIRQNCN